MMNNLKAVDKKQKKRRSHHRGKRALTLHREIKG
jgi:hypothetical protein